MKLLINNILKMLKLRKKGENKVMNILNFCTIKGELALFDSVAFGTPLQNANQANEWLTKIAESHPEITTLYILTTGDRCYYLTVEAKKIAKIEKAEALELFAESVVVDLADDLPIEEAVEVEAEVEAEQAVEIEIEKPQETVETESEVQDVIAEKVVEVEKFVQVAPDMDALKAVVKEALNEVLSELIAKLNG